MQPPQFATVSNIYIYIYNKNQFKFKLKKYISTKIIFREQSSDSFF